MKRLLIHAIGVWLPPLGLVAMSLWLCIGVEGHAGDFFVAGVFLGVFFLFWLYHCAVREGVQEYIDEHRRRLQQIRRVQMPSEGETQEAQQ